MRMRLKSLLRSKLLSAPAEVVKLFLYENIYIADVSNNWRKDPKSELQPNPKHPITILTYLRDRLRLSGQEGKSDSNQPACELSHYRNFLLDKNQELN